jgi:hypothetical protein
VVWACRKNDSNKERIKKWKEGDWNEPIKMEIFYETER